MTDPTDLIARLRKRAGFARGEGTGTALGDALHFEEAATALEALARENAELRAAQAWQPIETAPKDREVLIARYWPDGTLREVIPDTWTDGCSPDRGWLLGSKLWHHYPKAPLTFPPPPDANQGAPAP